MSVLRGHEDLQPKTVVGFDMGYALVQCGGEVKRYRMSIGPGGAFHGEPVPETEAFAPIDQIGTIGAEKRARRFHDVDQPIDFGKQHG